MQKIFLLLVSLLFSITISAANLKGSVTDFSGKSSFEGAIVTVDGTNFRTSTDREGNFSITGIEPGRYNIIVTYLGASPVSKNITISSGENEENFILGSNVDLTENLLVVGQAASTYNAIARQRASDQFLSVVDSDALGSFPDTTVAESVRRLSGVTVENDQGEGRYAILRGLGGNLNQVTIDGIAVVAPEDNRNVILDGLPSDMLESIEVFKSFTPDQDLDAIGGKINLKTLTAFDRPKNYVRVRAETSYNELTENDENYKTSIAYSNVFNDNFGLAISANAENREITSHNNESGGWGVDDATGFYLMDDDYEMRYYNLTRERLGLSVNLDFRLDNTDLYIKTFYNQYEDAEQRNKFELKGIDDIVDDGMYTVSQTGAIYAGELEVENESRPRIEERTIEKYSFGGITSLDDGLEIQYEISYSSATEQDTDRQNAVFNAEIDANHYIDWSNPEEPYVDFASAGFLNPYAYEADKFEYESNDRDDQELTFKFDVRQDFVFQGNPGSFKSGIKIKQREKNVNANVCAYDWSGEDYWPYGDQGLTDELTSDWRLRSSAGLIIDKEKARAIFQRFTGAQDEFGCFTMAGDSFFEYERGDTLEESVPGDFFADENITAGYAMFTFDLPETTIVVGARAEDTNVVTLSGRLDTATENYYYDTDRHDYLIVAPSINVKHLIDDDLQIRAALYGSLARPKFQDASSYAVIESEDREIEQGNPGLDPTITTSLDFGVDYFPGDVTWIGAGVFYKNLEDPIFGYELEDVATGSTSWTEFSSFLNADSATVLGLEFNVQTDIGALAGTMPGWLVGFNYTFVDSESTLPDGREVALQKTAESTGNFNIGYANDFIEAKIIASYRGAYIRELGSSPANEDINGEHTQVDLSIKGDITDELQITFDAVNINDAPEYYYFGADTRLMQYDEFGPRYSIGLRYTFTGN